MVIIQRKALALLVALGVALGVVGLLLSGSGPVAAQATPSATRTLPQSAVAPGSQFNVTVTLANVGAGSLVEKLPPGFSYVEGSVRPALLAATTTGQVATGQDVTITLIGSAPVTYGVTASDVAGTHDFRASTLSVIDLSAQTTTSYDVGGDDMVTVEASAPPPGNGSGNGGGGADPGASRSVSPMSVDRGGQVVVTVDLANAPAGQVVETLPSGLSYVAGSVSPGSVGVEQTGQDVLFTLLGQNPFSYTVMAGDMTGDQTIMGVLKVLDITTGQVAEYPIDDTTITVTGVDPSASRSISPSPVDPGVEATVTIDVAGASVGQVVETLPEGFGYVSGSVSPSSVGVEEMGQNITFTLLGQSSFSYRVTTPEMEQTYTFMGVLKVLDTATSETMNYPMDDTDLLVGIPPTATPVPPTATPVVDDKGTPVPPTRTPRPTPVPPPPPTPVAIEKVDVTAVEGATTVQPDESATISSADGMASVMLPNTSRARTYQVMVSSDMANCSGAPVTLQACASVTSYDAEGNMESDVMLIRRATVVMMLDAAAVEELGGLPTVFQANALGAFGVYQGNGDGWGARRFSMGLAEDGGVAVTVSGLRSFGSVALSVDEDVLTQAKLQTGIITPTPVPDPTATPEPTATPVPEPTAVPPDDKGPIVGDTTLPVGLLVVLALTGALMAYTGSRVLRRRPVSR